MSKKDMYGLHMDLGFGLTKRRRKTKKNMGFLEANLKFDLTPWGDADHDTVRNIFDCRPYNPRKHGYIPVLPHKGLMRDVRWVWDESSNPWTMYYDPIKEEKGEFAFGRTQFNMEKPTFPQKGGNLKIDRAFIVFNPGGTSSECPSRRRGLCPSYINEYCYALKPELGQSGRYPDTLAYRSRMKAEFYYHPAEKFIEEMEQRKQSSRKKEIKGMRFSGSGDISEQWELDKLIDIAKGIGKKDMIMYGYSKSRTDENTGKKLTWEKAPENMTVNFGPGKKVPGHNRYIPLPEEQFKAKVRQGLKKDERFCVPGRDVCGLEDDKCQACITGHDLDVYTVRRTGKRHATYLKMYQEAAREAEIEDDIEAAEEDIEELQEDVEA